MNEKVEKNFFLLGASEDSALSMLAPSIFSHYLQHLFALPRHEVPTQAADVIWCNDSSVEYQNLRSPNIVARTNVSERSGKCSNETNIHIGTYIGTWQFDIGGASASLSLPKPPCECGETPHDQGISAMGRKDEKGTT
jgi:hypothetical protein